ESTGEVVECLWGEGFRPDPGVQPAAFDLLHTDPAAQGIAEGLAPVGEGFSDEGGKVRADRKCGLRSDGESGNSRPHPWWGFEGAGTHVEQVLDRHPRGQHDGESAVVILVRLCRHAGNDFFLQHDVQILDDRGVLEKMEQERCRDVVGQVADDPQLAAALVCESSKVIFQCIDFVHREARPGVEIGLGSQQRDQVAIDFDRIEGTVPPAGEGFCGRSAAGLGLQKQTCQGAAAWADFDQVIVGVGGYCCDNGFEDVGVVEKMLPEALARAMCRCVAHWPQLWLANSIANSMAQPRLLGSARPVPAMSNAVPWSTEVRRIGKPSVMLTAVSKPACLITGRPWS